MMNYSTSYAYSLQVRGIRFISREEEGRKSHWVISQRMHSRKSFVPAEWTTWNEELDTK